MNSLKTFGKRPKYNMFFWLAVLITTVSSCTTADLSKIEKEVWYVSDDCDVALFFKTNTAESISGDYIKTNTSLANLSAFEAHIKGKKLSFNFKNDSKKNFKGRITFNEIGFEIETPDGKNITFIKHTQDMFISTKSRYKEVVFNDIDVAEEIYGTAHGYYASKIISKISADNYPSIIMSVLKGIVQNFNTEKVPLHMDIYTPRGDTVKERPLMLLVHGGAFVIGDKRDTFQIKLAEHYARCGYVVASINYRLGYMFIPGVYSNLERCMYKALQDVRAALRYLSNHSKRLSINTDYFFVSGNSAGGFLSLFTNFMEEHEKWQSTGDNIFLLQKDLGCLDCSTNEDIGNYKLAGIVSLWGAVHDLDIIDAYEKTPVLLIHGNADDIVPYDYDYPFKNIDSRLSAFFTKKMYGSKAIYDRMKTQGQDVTLRTIDGAGHEPQVNDDNSFNKYAGIIQNDIQSFMYKNLGTGKFKITGPEFVSLSDKRATYKVPYTSGDTILWVIEGGLIIKKSVNEAEVVWFNNADSRKIEAQSINKMGLKKHAVYNVAIRHIN